MKNTLLTTLAIAGLALSASAVPFSFTNTDTVLSSTFSEVSAGDAARIVIVVDNGNSDLGNQTWTIADVLSVSFDFGNGALTATFNISDANGLHEDNNGSITSDATGALTSVCTRIYSVAVVDNYSSNFSAYSLKWYVNGSNGVFTADDWAYHINITNAKNNTNPAYWTVAAVPEPATYAGIAGLGALALAIARKRKA